MLNFWANWCGPCKRLSPIIDELANEYQGKLKIIKIDVDNNQAIAEKYKDDGEAVSYLANKVIKGGGGEYEHNPAKDIAGFGLREGTMWEATFEATMNETRRLLARLTKFTMARLPFNIGDETV